MDILSDQLCDTFVLKGDNVITSSQAGPKPLILLVFKGKIHSIHPFESDPKAIIAAVGGGSKDCMEFVDAGEFVVMPGMVDTHGELTLPLL